MKIRFVDLGYDDVSTYRYRIQKRLFPFCWLTIFYTDHKKGAEEYFAKVNEKTIIEKEV